MIAAGIPLVLLLTPAGARPPGAAVVSPANSTAPGIINSSAGVPPINFGALRKRAPLLPGRNLFQFADAPRTANPAPHTRRTLTAGVVTPKLLDAPANLTLIGIAGEHTPAGFRRIAIIVDGHGEMQMARAADVVGGRHEVIAVGADSVDVKDLLTGVTQRARLR